MTHRQMTIMVLPFLNIASGFLGASVSVLSSRQRSSSLQFATPEDLRQEAEQLRSEIALLEEESSLSEGVESKQDEAASISDDRSIPGEPLAGTRWDIEIDIGREKGTWMPQLWGSRGERYVCTLEDVCFDCAEWSRTPVSAGGGGGSGADDFVAKGSGRAPVRTLTFGSSTSAASSASQFARAKVRGWERLAIIPGCWRRVGGTAAEASLRFFAALPEGLAGDDGGGGFDGRGSAVGSGSGAFGPGDGRDSTLSLPPGDVLYFATSCWGNTLSKGGVISVRRNAIWRREYRIVGTWRGIRRRRRAD